MKQEGFGSGKLNPNYKDGRSKKINYCVCGKKLSDYRGRLCIDCYRKKMKKLNKSFSNRNWHPKVRYGTNSNWWKGDAVGYTGIHDWLYREFGKASKCENKNCNNLRVKMFTYAKIRDLKYERKRENFIQLCNSCHKKYDLGTMEILV